MPRYYKRRFPFYPKAKKAKWEVSQKLLNGTLSPAQTTSFQIVVNGSNAQGGVKKIAHLRATINGPPSQASQTGTATTSLVWAFVYCPAGTTPGGLDTSGAEMYQPNQYVLGCGMLDLNANNSLYCPLRKNLNSGDSIYLLILSGGTVAVPVSMVVRHAICYN